MITKAKPKPKVTVGASFSVRFDEAERAGLAEAAAKADRPVAWIVRQFVREGLKKAGLINKLFACPTRTD